MNSLENLDVHDKRKRRTLIKTAQDLKKWLSRKPSWGKRKQFDRKSSNYGKTLIITYRKIYSVGSLVVPLEEYFLWK